MGPESVLVCVMSHERGTYLRNALASLERHAPQLPVVIFDDGSEDPSTVEALAEASRRYRVVKTPAGPRGKKTGGLAANMNAAVQLAHGEGYAFVWFVQDDMQLVRPVDDAFFDECAAAFGDRSDVVQLSVEFGKSPKVTGDRLLMWSPHPSGRFYTARDRSALGLVAVGIMRVKTLIEAGFEFAPRETETMAASRLRGFHRRHCWNPAIMFLPWPTTRGDYLPPLKRVGHWVSERIFRAGYHPFQDMTAADVQRLKSRDGALFPYGESYLSLAPGHSVVRPWWYQRAASFPEARLRFSSLVRPLRALRKRARDAG